MGHKRYKTRDGKHGTQYRYCVAYKAGPDSPVFDWFCWAYDAEHALELFHSDGDDGDDDYEIVKTRKMVAA